MSPSDEAEFVRLLKIFKEDQERGVPISEERFALHLQCLPAPAIECVIARLVRGKIEVFLAQRSADDPFYPNKAWHVPGTFLRPREKISDAMRRISAGELAPATIREHKFIFPNNNWCEPRGHSVGLVYLCDIIDEPQQGEWFETWPNDGLPADLIEFQRDFLMPALAPLFIDRRRP